MANNLQPSSLQIGVDLLNPKAAQRIASHRPYDMRREYKTKEDPIILLFVYEATSLVIALAPAADT
jgi:hypothetical protein